MSNSLPSHGLLDQGIQPGKSHRRRGLVGCSPWGREESDTTERLPFHFSLPCIGEGNGNPLQCSCLESPRDEGDWWAAVFGVAQSRTRLKWLSSRKSYCLPFKNRLIQIAQEFLAFVLLLAWNADVIHISTAAILQPWSQISHSDPQKGGRGRVELISEFPRIPIRLRKINPLLG